MLVSGVNLGAFREELFGDGATDPCPAAVTTATLPLNLPVPAISNALLVVFSPTMPANGGAGDERTAPRLLGNAQAFIPFGHALRPAEEPTFNCPAPSPTDK